MKIHLFVAQKAFIVQENRVLIVRESHSYKDGVNEGTYDVPGGRLEVGENLIAGLLREVKEETGLNITIGEPFFVNEWRPVKNGEIWHIIGIFYRCTVDSARVTLGQDHDHFEWIDPTEYTKYPLIKNLEKAFIAYNSRT